MPILDLKAALNRFSIEFEDWVPEQLPLTPFHKIQSTPTCEQLSIVLHTSNNDIGDTMSKPVSLLACPLLSAALTLFSSGLLHAPAQAQDYPSRPIQLTVGFPAGGSSDVVARLLAQKLGASFKQSVIVENKPGAGGTIGSAAVAAAKPDGYSLLFVTSGHAGAGALYPKLSFDPAKSFTPVIGVSSFPVLIVANATAPYNSISDVIGAARQAPGKLDYTAGGAGATVTAMAAEFLKNEAKIDMQQINFAGSGPALIAVMGGQIQLAFDLSSSSLPHIKAGKLKPLAVTSLARSPFLPDVPTIAETVLPGFELLGWFGILAPAGTPLTIVARLNKELDDVLKQPDVRQQFATLGIEPYGGSIARFQQLVESDTQRVGAAIRRLGMTPN